MQLISVPLADRVRPTLPRSRSFVLRRWETRGRGKKEKCRSIMLTRVHFHRSPLISLQHPSLSTTDVTLKLCTRKRNSIREDLAVAKINCEITDGGKKKAQKRRMESVGWANVRQRRIKMASSGSNCHRQSWIFNPSSQKK